jgi:phage repressor protein C with HTH and peptisase S24 domain
MDASLADVPIISMPKGDNLSHRIGVAIKTARKQRGFVQRNIAEHVGIAVAAVGQWEIGASRPSFDNLVKTAEKLRVDPTALGRGELVFLDGENLGDAEMVAEIAPPAMGPMDLEVRGASFGGDDGDFTFNGEVNGFVRRPPGIANLRNVFALHVLSTSMVPKFEPGELIIVGGREPVPGDHVVIEMFPENEGEAGKSFVKKLIRRTAKEIVVEQYNPVKEITFDRFAVKALWRVIPTKELLGF